jgi:hypothetical protein
MIYPATAQPSPAQQQRVWTRITRECVYTGSFLHNVPRSEEEKKKKTPLAQHMKRMTYAHNVCTALGWRNRDPRRRFIRRGRPFFVISSIHRASGVIDYITYEQKKRGENIKVANALILYFSRSFITRVHICILKCYQGKEKKLLIIQSKLVS